MITLLSYELKKQMKTILFTSISIIAAFAAMYEIMKLLPGFVINAIMLINKTPYLLSFLGKSDYIESITFYQGAMVIMTPVNVFLSYKLLTYAVHSFMGDRQSGMLLYFYSLSVSKTKYWFSKVISAFVYYIACILILSLCTTLMSLSGIPVKILRDITLENVFTRILSTASTGFMLLSMGILIYTLFAQKAAAFIRGTYMVMLLICVLPNFIRSLPSSILSGIYNPVCSIRNLVPVYWCSPYNTFNRTACIIAVVIGLLSLFVSLIIFRRKSAF